MPRPPSRRWPPRPTASSSAAGRTSSTTCGSACGSRSCWWTSPTCPTTASSHSLTAASVSARWCATATWLRTARFASAIPCSLRRCSTGPRASCATWPPPAATCCSAPAASTSRTSRSPATSACRAAAAPRARAITASWPSWAPRRRASPRTPRTWPSRWPRSTPSSACRGRAASGRSRSLTFHRLPGDEPQRDTVLAHGELITARRLAAASVRGALALPQGA